MESFAINQFLLLISLCIVVAVLLLSLFKLRGIFGLGIFYVTLGLFKYLHFFLTRAFSLQISPSTHISLGSILFTGLLFSILLIYIYKDALEARKVIYALIAVNIVFVIMQAAISVGLRTQGLINNYNLPTSFFNINLRVAIIGTLLIFIDSFIIIYIYEIISTRIKFLLLRIFLTMAIVFLVHSIAFAIGGFAGTNRLYPVLISGLVSKGISVPVFALLFWGYLVYLDAEVDVFINKNKSFKDVFNVLAYPKKIRQLSKEKTALQQVLENTQNYLQTIFDSTTDALFIHDGKTGTIIDVNNQMCEMYGYNKLEVLDTDVHKFSLGKSPYSSKESQQWLNKAKKEGLQTFEWISKRKNGSTFWTEVSLRYTTIAIKSICIATVRNIDDRKKAEEKTLSEILLNKIILETTMDGYILADDKGEIKNVNPAYCNIVGFTKNELLAKNIADLEVKITDEKLNERIQEMIQKGHVQFETQHRHKNGEIIDLEVSISVLNSQNKPLLAAFVRDITQKNKEKQEIIKLNNLLLEAENIAHVGFLDWNLDTNNLKVSPEVKRIYQIPKNTKNIREFILSNIHPDDLDMVNEGLTLASKGVKDLNIDHRILQKNGTVRWVNANTKLIQQNRLLGTILDITERKKAAEELKLYSNKLVESISELNQIHKLGQHLSVSYTIDELANKALDEMELAVAPDVSLFYLLKNNELKLVAHRKNNVEFDESIENTHPLGECLCGIAAKTKEAVFSEDSHKDIRCTLDNCKNSEINSFAALPLKAENKIIGLIGLGYKTKQNFKNNKSFIETLAFDVAIALQNVLLLNNLRKHKIELEETVKQRTAQLERSNSELRDFAQIVSHDLKAPLRAISQLSFWISQDYADKIDEEGQNQLKLLISRVQRLDNLIEGILQYSRAGRVREKEVEINFNEIVNETVQLLNPPSTIKIVIENKLPNYIGDQTRFTQLFQNLIHNAIKSINKPKGSIKIGCVKKDNFWEFYVADNGIGIEEKYFERIFTIFQRLESRDEKEGTGVGLSLVKRIVQIYGGDIWVKSKVGKGSTFIFTLPVIQNN